MDYTYATVVIPDNDKSLAQSVMGEGFFNSPLSSDGQAPATHWMSSGAFMNNELEMIINQVRTVIVDEVETTEPFVINHVVSFGQDWQSFVTSRGLVVVSQQE
jgi:hypothetical protein